MLPSGRRARKRRRNAGARRGHVEVAPARRAPYSLPVRSSGPNRRGGRTRRTWTAAAVLLPAALAASACDDASSGDPCAGVDCSGHGVCHTDGIWPLCACDPGWLPSGRWCVPGSDVGADGDADAGEVSRTCGDGVVDLTEECDDGNAVEDDGCTSRCTYSCHVAADCEDGNECTEDLCLTNAVGRACSSGPTRIGETCDDGNDCTNEEVCTSDGECVGSPAPTDTLCDDGLFCNGAPDVCDGSGGCVPMSMPPCPVADCVAGCDEATDACLPAGEDAPCRPAAHQCDVPELCDGTSTTCPTDALAPSGTACDDGNACTDGDHCDDAGTCVSGGNIC